MEWIKTKDRKPPKGARVFVAHLHEYSNAPWHFTFEVDSWTGEAWSEFMAPYAWAIPIAPEIPDTPERRKALVVHARENEYRQRLQELREEYRKK